MSHEEGSRQTDEVTGIPIGGALLGLFTQAMK